MKKTLIAFEELINNTRLIVLDVDDEQAELLQSFHRRYVGAEDVDPTIERRIIEFFYDGSEFRYASSVVEGPIKDAAFDLVILTGDLS